MDDTPRKTLSLKPRTTPAAIAPPQTTQTAKKPPVATDDAKANDKPQPPKKAPARVKKKRVQVPRTRTPPTTIKARKLLAKLAVDHPALFAMEGEATPWVVGIHMDIVRQYKVSQAVVKKALTTWMATRVDAYRAAVRSGKLRMGLEIIE